MDPEQNPLAVLFPQIATQMRGALNNLHLAASQLIPAAAREADPVLDAKAAVLDQSYYQLLRLVTSLSAASLLTEDRPLPLCDRDIVDLVGDICDRAGDLAPMLGLELRFVCALEHHICAVAPNELEHLLYALLSNAFKFTPSGGTVTVELKLVNNRVLLSVTDTGCGISEDRLDTLFDHYLHRDPMDAPPHGFGLGLSLCRHIAEGLGGSLMVESRLGKGSRFTLSLPDRQIGGSISDAPFDYSGGFNRTLLLLSDALPVKAFLVRNQD